MIHLIAFIVLLIALAAPPGHALAHAVLLDTDPPNGAALESAPRRVVLHFNEPVSPISLRLDGAGINRLLAADATGHAIEATLPESLADGAYLLSYRVTSSDSHPVAGTVAFRVGTVGETAPVAAPRNHDEINTALAALNRAIMLGALFFAGGGVLFGAIVLGGQGAQRVRMHSSIRIAALLAIATAELSIILQGALLSGQALLDLETWDTVVATGWRSGVGRSAAVIAIGMLGVAIFAHRDANQIGGRLALAGSLIALAVPAWSGHSMTASPLWLSLVAATLHSLTLGFWAGALWPLLRLLSLPPHQAADVVERFSKIAVVAVAVLLASGLTMALLHVAHPRNLVTTAYGQVLLLKLAVLSLVLALAAYNKLRLTPALRAGATGADSALRTSIRLEIAGLLLLLVIATLLGRTPPHAPALALSLLAEHHHQDHAVDAATGTTATGGITGPKVSATGRGHDGAYRADLTLTPAMAGERNALVVTVTGPRGEPFDAVEVAADLTLPDSALGTVSVPLRRTAAGRYEADSDGLVHPGVWQLRLSLLIDSFSRLDLEASLAVGAKPQGLAPSSTHRSPIKRTGAAEQP